MDEQQIYAIERPCGRLLTLYFFRSLLTGPGFVFLFPYLFVRYRTLRYRFDGEGVHMRWGLLFRREINLTYARIQDVHLAMGILQRWLKLADVHIQTASGSTTPEMTIEGLVEHRALRDFLYSRMRGVRQAESTQRAPSAGGFDPRAVELLKEIHDELHAANEALATIAREDGRRA